MSNPFAGQMVAATSTILTQGVGVLRLDDSVDELTAAFAAFCEWTTVFVGNSE